MLAVEASGGGAAVVLEVLGGVVDVELVVELDPFAPFAVPLVVVDPDCEADEPRSWWR